MDGQLIESNVKIFSSRAVKLRLWSGERVQRLLRTKKTISRSVNNQIIEVRHLKRLTAHRANERKLWWNLVRFTELSWARFFRRSQHYVKIGRFKNSNQQSIHHFHDKPEFNLKFMTTPSAIDCRLKLINVIAELLSVNLFVWACCVTTHVLFRQWRK